MCDPLLDFSAVIDLQHALEALDILVGAARRASLWAARRPWWRWWQ